MHSTVCSLAASAWKIFAACSGVFPSCVKRNCNIANANHAADSTLCIYLLKMREYYRWQNRLPFDATLDEAALGEWLHEQEAHWETIENQPFQPLPLAGRCIDPFDVATVNRALGAEGLVYSAGLGVRGAVHFFLADLHSTRRCDGIEILIAGTEHARDVSALPAMSLAGSVFVRRDAIARMLWEKAAEASWHKHDTPMRRALHAYDFEQTPGKAITRMVDGELETFVQHELGELRARALLGSAWTDLLAGALGGPGEPVIRAVRDNLADALTTLPFLSRDFRPAALHFYFATLGPLRKTLQPGLFDAYEAWRQSGQPGPLRNLIERSAAHWLAVAEKMPTREWLRDTTDGFLAAHAL